MSAETVKQLMNASHKAYKSGDSRMVKRIMALLDFSRGGQPEAIVSKHGMALSSLYSWLKALLIDGVASLKAKWRGGRPKKLIGQ